MFLTIFDAMLEWVKRVMDVMSFRTPALWVLAVVTWVLLGLSFLIVAVRLWEEL